MAIYFSSSRWVACACIALGLLAGLPVASAGDIDIASKPISGTATVDVKPNIMLLMDTSKSMSFSHMPDALEGEADALPIGYKNYQCNTLYYNPNTIYARPKDSIGERLPVPSFNAARYNYYSLTDTSTVDLATAFRAFDNNTRSKSGAEATPTAAHYYIYSGAETLSYLTAPCTQVDEDMTKATPGGGTWTKKIVSSTSGLGSTVDERENFAIWYVYYRTRLAMTKSSLSLAFATLTDRFRVGFITASPGVPVAASKYLAIADFTTANKAAWYAKVFSQNAEGSSPMREGLARVGRHYAGKQDTINLGMTGDPVQYSCQNNFTLMTTDGYWNTAAETRGPVQLDGVTPIGQQDGVLTDSAGETPRPIWDGGSTALRTTTSKSNAYNFANCAVGVDAGPFYVNKSTTQDTFTDTSVRQSTLQRLQATLQNLQSTQKVETSTTQRLSTTTQVNKVTARTEQSTVQIKQSTAQNLVSTVQYQQYTKTLTQTQTKVSIATSQLQKTTVQPKIATSQLQQSQTRQDQTSTQTTQTVLQAIATTAQTVISTARNTATTLQWQAATSQTKQTVTQVSKSTSQLNSYNGSTELTTPTATCTPNTSLQISCFTAVTGPTLVSACTPATASSANNYTTTTCTTTTVSGPVAVATCTPVTASSSNSFQTTACNTVTTAATPVASCTTATASSGNAYTSTTCTSTATGPTNVQTCTNAAASSANAYTATTCAVVSTGPTGTASCSPISATSANSWTTTSCNVVNGATTYVASCTPIAASASNSYTATNCTNNNSVTFVQTCTAQTATSGNNWLGRTCSTSTSTVPVATCTAQTAASGNNWLGITCPALVTVTAAVGVQTCTAVAATSPGFVATKCTTVTTGPTAVQTCTPITAGSGNAWMTTTCPTVNTGPTGTNSCTAATGTSSNSWVTTTCNTVTTGPTDVASCTAITAASGNQYKTTSCPVTTVSPATPVTSCTPVTASSTNGFVTTACTNPQTATVYLASCTPGSTTVGAVTTVCTKAVTGPTGILTCTPQTAASGNSWLEKTCSVNNTGPTAVATCTAATAASGNSFVTTTCATATLTGPTPVATCTAELPISGNGFVATVCTPVNTGPTPDGSCVASAASSTNSYTTTTCPITASAATGVASCTDVAASSANNYTAITCSNNNTGPTLVASCTPQTAASGNSWVGRTCTTTPLSGPTPVATCTAATGSAANSYVATLCSTNNTAATPVASCTDQAKSSGNFQTQTVCSSVATGPTPVATCAASAGSTPNFVTTSCTPVSATGYVVACAPVLPTSANGYTTRACSTDATGPVIVPASTCTSGTDANSKVTTCPAVTAQKIQVTKTTTEFTETLSNSIVVATSATTTTTDATVNVDNICYTPGIDTLPALPTAQPALPSGCSTWPCSVTTGGIAGGSANSLADVAQYYYINDLRPEASMPNDMKPIGSGPEDDRATWQHMSTYGIGLGVAGTLPYTSDYKSASTGSIVNIRAGTQGWPVWPDPLVDYSDARNYNNPKSIDDFWHAAVNGRGQYFSASNPDTVVQGLSAALTSIVSVAGSGGAATMSSGIPVVSDNYAYVTNFVSVAWTGDVQARTIDVNLGAISNTVEWSARDKLNTMVGSACDNRKIFIRRSGATNAASVVTNLANFTMDSKACDSTGAPTGIADTGLNTSEQALFGASAVADLTHYAAMTDGTSSTVNQRSLAAGANLVNFVRGQRGFEGFIANNATKLYRSRSHVMGDIVGSVALSVKAPAAEYGDAGYSAFKASNASRTPMLYVGSNGGMLHAIYAPSSTTDPLYSSVGKEAWAYIPQVVMPNLHYLADNDYKNNHRYFVDGSPSTGDVFDTTSSTWKTMLVGGLNAGGKGYYALDITDPVNPKSMWEFNVSSACYTEGATGIRSDCQLGLTFGRPVITKLANGTWVVLVTSGYNNTTGSGTGRGYLYVLNAITGEIINRLDTGAGSTANPSGLRDVNTYVANGSLDNTTLRAYGGDLLGNIWRFDVNDLILPAGKEATLVAVAKDSLGVVQPITTRVQLAEVDGRTMIVVATGRLVGDSDLATTQVQSVYGFKDTPGEALVHANLRGELLTNTLTQVDPTTTGPTSTRTAACSGNTVNCAITEGWVLDLPEAKERVSVDPLVILGTVTFVSNVPQNSSCQAGGHSWANYVNLLNGNTVPSSPTGLASNYLNGSLSVGLSYVMLQSGQVIGTSVGSDTSTTTFIVPVEPPSPQGRRVSWREVKK